MDTVLWFDDIGLADVEQVGGKGANLGELTRAGLPVPRGFVVTRTRAICSPTNHGLRDESDWRPASAIGRVAAGPPPLPREVLEVETSTKQTFGGTQPPDSSGGSVMTSDQWYASRMTEIETEECYELLGSRQVGRIAFVVDDAPIVLPVNYAVDGDDIVFRTSPRTELGRRMIRGRVAFEVDDFDEFNQSGWSVLFQGSVEYDDSAEVWPDDHVRPWAEGVRNLVVRIRPRLVTGRRLLGP